MLPKHIILVRHAESQGNIDHFAYSKVPDPQICLVRLPPQLSVPLLEPSWMIPGEACHATRLRFLVSAFTRSPGQCALLLLQQQLLPSEINMKLICGQLLQTDRGIQQAQDAGEKIKRMMESDGHPYRLYFYMCAAVPLYILTCIFMAPKDALAVCMRRKALGSCPVFQDQTPGCCSSGAGSCYFHRYICLHACTCPH